MAGGRRPVAPTGLGSWSGRRLIAAWAVVIALGALVQVATRAVADGQSLLDTRRGWTPEEAHRLLGELGAGGRAGWGRMLALDAAFGICFGVAAAATFARVAGPSPSSAARAAARAGIVAGLAVALADVVEDGLFAVLLASWPTFPAGVPALASWVTTVKLGLVLAVLACLALAAIVVVVRVFRKRRAGRS